MPFINERFELSVDLGQRGGPSFRTDIAEMGQGLEDSQAHWDEDLGVWQAGERTLNEANKEYMLGFWRSVKGMHIGFRFKDWIDYRAIGENIGSGDDTAVDFQLARTFGSTIKTIYLPVVSTVRVYFDGVEQLSDWVVDDLTGIVTFDTPPTAGQVISADFEYDKPARFDTDQFPCQFLAVDLQTPEAIYELGSLPIKELREPR